MKGFKNILFFMCIILGFSVSAYSLNQTSNSDNATNQQTSATNRCDDGTPYNGPWKNETGNNVFNPKFVCQNDLAIKHSNQCYGVYNASPDQPTVMGLYGGDYHTGQPLVSGNVYANQEFIPTCAALYKQCASTDSCAKCLDGSCKQ